MRPMRPRHHRRATVLVLIIGLLTMLFVMLTSFLTLARSERQAVVQIERGARTEEIIDNLTDVLSSIGLTNEEGLGYNRIPGYGDAAWIAANNPYYDLTLSATSAPRYRYLNTTSLNGTPQTKQSVRDVSFNPTGMTDEEWRRTNARRPFMDADADGIPDSDFGGSSLATQIANSVAGRSVNANIIPDPNSNDAANGERIRELWRQFDENTRYEAAVRIISHGGMVQLASPTATKRWNTAFLMGMFDYLRDPRDNSSALDPLTEGTGSDIERFNALYAQRNEVEAFLRYRGGILNPSSTSGAVSGIAALDQFANRIAAYGDPSYSIFASYVNFPPRDAYQRFNLAETGQWDAWGTAVNLSADSSYTPVIARENYAERRDLTTVNNSDDLIRKQGEYVEAMETARPTPRLAPGSSKFYLGRIASSFDLSGVFDTSSQINDLLAASFGEMLASYTGWRGTTYFDSFADPTLLRSEQAYMLAANTLAFAAPYTGDPALGGAGIWIDVPWVREDISGGYRLYFGVAPQPYLTQTLVFKDADSADPNVMKNGAAIELFNPHDVTLDPSQFGISVINPAVSGAETIKQLDPASTAAATGGATLRFDPRIFSLLIVDDGGNTYLRDAGRFYGAESLAGNTVPKLSADVPAGGTDLKVRLWRIARKPPAEINVAPYARGDGSAWVLIDELKVEQPANRDPNAPTDPNDPNAWQGSWSDGWRDTSSEPAYWAPSSLLGTARWRIVIPDAQEETGDGKPDAARLLNVKADGPNWTGTQIPTTPLYTMNPLVGQTLTPPIHGAVRPAAFPTVGYMHFIGRFAHTFSAVAGDVEGPWFTAGDWLEYAWRYDLQSAVQARADLAFMPVFSNRRGVFAESEFDESKLGRVPWGLLIYDYFTTLNVRDPDGNGNSDDALDPMRVDGRININDAPWHVLAALPVIGPQTSGVLPINQTVPPSLRSIASNMLLGDGPTEKRLLAQVPGSPITQPSGGNTWYRLGNRLAQAAASYRDGLRYTASADPFYGTAHTRKATAGPYRNPTLYSDAAGAATGGVRAPNHPGFVSIGELLNVVGFDSTYLAGSLTDYNGTTLSTGDYIRAVSLLATLDTHFLTTRSNTYTLYASLIDRESPESSLRTQVTFDRSNLVPRSFNPNPTGQVISKIATPAPVSSKPEIISERRGGYFATGVE